MAANESCTPFQLMLSSCSGAFLSACLMTPFDVVKTRLQAQHSGQVTGRCIQSVCPDLVQLCVVCEEQTMLRGTRDAFTKIAQTEGLPSLWRGLAPTLLMSLPSTMIYYTAYDSLKPHLVSFFGVAAAPTVAGITARAGTAVLVSPLELLRTNALSLQGKGGLSMYSELFVRMYGMVQANGVAALWRGLVPTLWRDIPFSAIYWTAYEAGKRSLDRIRGTTKRESALDRFRSSFALGACAGMVAATLTTPFDVVKTHQQLDLSGHRAPKPMLEVMQSIVARSGPAGLFVGLPPRLAKVAPACAIMIGTYEWGKMYFASSRAEEN